MILGIDHIDLRVQDIDAAIRFYCEGLGLTLKRRNEHNGIVITPDGIILELSPGTDGWDAGGITHVCYNTYDADAAFRRALEYGAVPSRPQTPEPYTDRGLCVAFVRAPSGEEIEFWSVRQPDGSFGRPAREGRTIKSFVHVGLTVPDVPACAGFYSGLGAKLQTEWEGGCSMILPDGRGIELFSGSPVSGEPKAYSHVSLLTDDTDAELEKLVKLGGKVGHEPYDWSNLRIAFATGLAGEVIEFFCFYQDGREPDVFEAPPDPLADILEKL